MDELKMESLPKRAPRKRSRGRRGRGNAQDAGSSAAIPSKNPRTSDTVDSKTTSKADAVAASGDSKAMAAPGAQSAQKAQTPATTPARKPRPVQYEYLDHIADIRFHSWGNDLNEACEQMVICMFSYMTEIDTVEMDPTQTITVDVKAHDMESMLYSLLDEFLYRFSVDDVVCCDCEILKMDLEQWRVQARGFGERFSLQKHPQGTEIKAITRHDMKIVKKPDGSYHVYVLVDI